MYIMTKKLKSISHMIHVKRVTSYSSYKKAKEVCAMIHWLNYILCYLVTYH